MQSDTPDGSADMVLSVCIPAYGVEQETLQATIDSALRQLPDSSELILLPSGPDLNGVASELRLSPRVVVAPSAETVDLVGNWNRCLRLARGELIHILHSDDLVAPGFYEAILGLRRRFPEAVLYATAAADFDDRVREVRTRTSAAEARLLKRSEAARFLLDDPHHSCGNVVLTRAVVRRCGAFNEQYPYCPDEEAFLRYAAGGAMALDPRRLYLQRRHAGQARFWTWRQPDFVEVYVRSRLSGAEAFGADVARFACESTRRRVISVAISLALAGEQQKALRTLDELAEHLPGASGNLRLRAARLATARPLRPLVAGRRRLLALLRQRRPEGII